MSVSLYGAAVGIPPSDCWIPNRDLENPRQYQAGSLTGAVASERATEASKGSLSADGNRAKSTKAEGSLTARQTRRAGAKAGLSDPVERKWNCHRSTDKSYPGDNRLISPKSPYRRGGLAPRCRLITSWGWSRSQGLGCSPIKVVRELGSERRETVRSISIAGERSMKGAAPSTRGPEWTDRQRTGYGASRTAG